MGSVFGHVRFLLPVCQLNWFLYTLNIGKQEVGIWWVQKRFPQYGVPIWNLWPNIRFLPSIVAEKYATKNEHTVLPRSIASVFEPIRFLLPVCRLLIFIHIEHIQCSLVKPPPSVQSVVFYNDLDVPSYKWRFKNLSTLTKICKLYRTFPMWI
jgi:TRAP-type mannitol/chloroaromatic compound transport system permease small subunit